MQDDIQNMKNLKLNKGNLMFFLKYSFWDTFLYYHVSKFQWKNTNHTFSPFLKKKIDENVKKVYFS